jgi:hypothetical protein
MNRTCGDLPARLCVPAAYWMLCSLVVVAGLAVGGGLLAAWPDAPPRVHLIDYVANADARHYRQIAEHGYSYEPGTRSMVAFWPLYPLLASGLGRLPAIEYEWSLVVVSNLALLAAFIMLARYAVVRFPELPADYSDYCLLALGLFPLGFFLRAPLSESVFLALSVGAMSLIAKGRPWWMCAAVVGLATAARPVGVALLAPLAIDIWRRTSRAQRWIALPAGLAIGCWGLLAYMPYLHVQFGNAFAFADAQMQWRIRDPVPWGEHLFALARLEPIWTVFDPASPAFWGNPRWPVPFWCNLNLLNPFVFVAAIVLLTIGKCRSWLNWEETALVAGLLFIPYVTRSFDMGMISMGRFVSVAFPLYLVLGHIMVRIPGPLAAIVLALSAVWLAIFSAQFAAGYPMA